MSVICIVIGIPVHVVITYTYAYIGGVHVVGLV